MTPNHSPQSREQLVAEEAAWYGNAPATWGPKLLAPTPKQADRQVLALRFHETREVAKLWAVGSALPNPLGATVRGFVEQVDRLNGFIAGTAAPRANAKDEDSFAPDFSGMTCEAIRAKRATLCIGAKRATVQIMALDYPAACATLTAALSVCFTSGQGP